jgi:ribonuclease HI
MKADDSNASTTTPSKFYAVQNGRIPGVYTDWPSAQKQITGWTKPKHKSFSTRAEAYAFVQAGQSDGSPVSNVNIDLDDSASQPQSKKAKRDNKKETATPVPMDKDSLGELNPMLAPLPSDAEDGFDRRMIMDLETGEMRWKTAEELSARKLMYKPDNYADSMSIYTDGACRGNGKKGAFGGVGVYFGPQDPRYVFLLVFCIGPTELTAK